MRSQRVHSSAVFLAGVIVGIAAPLTASRADDPVSPPPKDSPEVRSILARAFREAETIPDASLRIHNLRDVAEAQANSGARDAARETLRKAQWFAEAQRDPCDRVNGFMIVAPLLAKVAGREDALRLLRRAEAIVDGLPDPIDRAAWLVWVAQTVAEESDREGELRMFRKAADTAAAVDPATFTPDKSFQQSLFFGALEDCAQLQARLGDASAARATLARVVDLAGSLKDARESCRTLHDLARAAAQIDDPALARKAAEKALAVARSTKNDFDKEYLQTDAAVAWAEIGDYDRALEILRDLPPDSFPYLVTSTGVGPEIDGALGSIVGALGSSDQETRRVVTEKLFQLIKKKLGPESRPRALSDVARALIEIGEVARARAIADDLGRGDGALPPGKPDDPPSGFATARAEVLADLAVVSARAGDRDGVERAAREVLRVRDRLRTARLPSDTPYEPGQRARPEQLKKLRDLEERKQYEREERAIVLAGWTQKLVGARAALGDVAGAEALVDSMEGGAPRIVSPRIESQITVAQAQFKKGDRDAARASLRRAWTETAGIPDDDHQFATSTTQKLYLQIVKTYVDAGACAEAIEVFRSVDPSYEAIAAIARGLARTAGVRAAADWASSLEDPWQRTVGLLEASGCLP